MQGTKPAMASLLSPELPSSSQRAHLSRGLSVSLLPQVTFHLEAATLSRAKQVPVIRLGSPVRLAEHHAESGDLSSSPAWPLTGYLTLLASVFLPRALNSPHLENEGSFLGSLSGQNIYDLI